MKKLEEIKFEKITLDWQKRSYHELPKASGVYQIYGTSALYGLDTLLYIGKTTDLQKRMKGHFEFKEGVIGRQPNKSCRYALLDNSLLDIVEQTLIIMHKPSFNSARLIRVSPLVKSRPVYIQNHGERGMLNIENTNYYFLNLPTGADIDINELVPLHS